MEADRRPLTPTERQSVWDALDETVGKVCHHCENGELEPSDYLSYVWDCEPPRPVIFMTCQPSHSQINRRILPLGATTPIP